MILYDPIGELLGSWSNEINIWSILFRIALSIVMASIIGYERSSKRHAAGLRTFILVSLAGTLAMVIDLLLMRDFNQGWWMLSTATTVGVAIISSNTILYSSKNQIKGLTTSVALFVNIMLGLLTGYGNYTIVLICGVIFILVLSILPDVEIFLKNRSNHFEFHLELKHVSNLKDFTTVLRELGLRIDGIESNPAYIGSGLSVYSVSVSIISKELKAFKTHEEIIAALNTLDYVHYIEEMR